MASVKLMKTDLSCNSSAESSGGWHENKMVLVSKKFWQSEPARERVAQGHGPWKTFVLKANMAKLSFNGG